MSLRLRLTLTYSVLVALILALFGSVLYSTLRRDLEQEMDKRLRVRASQVELTIFPGTFSLTANSLASAKLDLSPLDDLDDPGLYVQVLDRAGQVVATSSNLQGQALPATTAALATTRSGDRGFTTIDIGQDRAVRVLSQPITSQGSVVGTLQVGQSRQPLQQTLHALRTLLVLLGIGALAVCGAIGWLVAYHGLRPLRLMSARAAAITVQQAFDQRLGIHGGPAEVDRLARTIDALLATVDSLLRSHREFVADTSHELRNPLLALRTNLDLIDRVPDTDSRAECVREAQEQVERMSRLVADLLTLARAEASQFMERRPVDLAAVIEQIAREAVQQAHGQQVITGTLEPIEVLGDAGRLAQVVNNLTTNALQHTSAGGTIRLTLACVSGCACLIVSDTGEGIQPEDLPHVFERFYQGRGSDGRHQRGTGLGLAIVEHLVRAHGGHITVDSTPGRGSCFTVWLPLSGAPVAPTAALASHD